MGLCRMAAPACGELLRQLKLRLIRLLMQAIQAHKSRGSEASRSVDLFNFLSPTAQQDLLNFLRSL